MTSRVKTLAYRRAQFLIDGSGPLESLLIRAHQIRPNIEDRTITQDNQIVLECRNFKHKPGSGVFLHIAAYTPGEQASVVRRVRGVPSGDLETAPAPDGCEFMDGDTMLFVACDHVIVCSSSHRSFHFPINGSTNPMLVLGCSQCSGSCGVLYTHQ